MKLRFNDAKGGEAMSKRQQLKIILERGSLHRCKIETYVVCNGKRTLRSVEATDAPLDIEINVYCNEMNQLELQDNKHSINIKK
jgi:hypothetical protein